MSKKCYDVCVYTNHNTVHTTQEVKGTTLALGYGTLGKAARPAAPSRPRRRGRSRCGTQHSSGRCVRLRALTLRTQLEGGPAAALLRACAIACSHRATSCARSTSTSRAEAKLCCWVDTCCCKRTTWRRRRRGRRREEGPLGRSEDEGGMGSRGGAGRKVRRGRWRADGFAGPGRRWRWR
jgi:hypothetical protein